MMVFLCQSEMAGPLPFVCAPSHSEILLDGTVKRFVAEEGLAQFSLE
jgi:hypothetical protein